MQTVISNFRISQNRATAASPCGLLPGGWSSSPKSPKFNELLAKHHAFQRQEHDFKSSIKAEGGATTIEVLVL
ncbi:MAG: hypothetical protein M0P59_04750 [Gallionella sp.]|jgi:hypothetical protein|nr:hypothetical protein [Gallionella sp.]MCK9353452.1 hypothetical protein [Gallionella sp.]